MKTRRPIVPRPEQRLLLIVCQRQERERDQTRHRALTPDQRLKSYLSALSAVSVNTDTPTEVSWMTGMSLQAASPNTHSSNK